MSPIEKVADDLHHFSDPDSAVEAIRALFEGISDQFDSLSPEIRWYLFQKVHLPLISKVFDGYQRISHHIESSFYPINSDGKLQDLDRLVHGSIVMYHISETLKRWSLDVYYIEFFEVADADDLLYGVWESTIGEIQRLLEDGMKLLAHEYFQWIILPLNHYSKKLLILM
jgi:hypothetical protein